MVNLVQRIKEKLFSSVSRHRAIEIARKACLPDSESFVVYDIKPESCRIYKEIKEPCWFVYGPWNDGNDGMMLRSSHVTVVSRKTGELLYKGSAMDEG